MKNNISLKNKKSPFSYSLRLKKLAWIIVRLIFFRYSPAFLFSYRRFILKLFGAKMGIRSFVYPNTIITMPWNLEMGNHCVLGPNVICYNTAKIIISNHVTVSQYSYLCSATHDHQSSNFDLYALPIIIKEQSWVAADVFIGPGVTVAEGCVIGAKSALFKSTKKWTIYGGNPARPIKNRVINKLKR